MSAQRIARGSMLIGAAMCAFAFLLVMLASPVPHVDRTADTYWGARILPPGPAWTGLPLLRVGIAPDGTLVAVPVDLHWLQYNDQANAPGLSASYAGNDTFRYNDNPEKLRGYDLTDA